MTTFLLRKKTMPPNSHRKNQKILALPSVSIPSNPNEPALKPTLSNSAVTVTNHPDPCLLCNKHQCVYDYNHEVYFTVKAACEEKLDQIWKQKPLDDPGG